MSKAYVTVIQQIVKSKHFWLALIVSTAISAVLVRALGTEAATKIVGADNTNVRTLYYHIVANIEDNEEDSDELVLYNPFISTYRTDRIKQLAEELSIVSNYSPNVIVFDYILTDTLSYNPESKLALIDAIQHCIDAGIVFIATEVMDASDENRIRSERSFFQGPPYFLSVESGNSFTSFDRLKNVSADGELPWIPIVVSRHILSRPPHADAFYNRRYINFSPGRISTANSCMDQHMLSERLSSKVVVFSDYTLADDMHELLHFPIRGVVEGDSNIKSRVSGAELLWYSIRDELEDKWDVRVHWSLVLFFTLVFSFFYFVSLGKIKYCSKIKSRRPIGHSMRSFLLFALFELFILGIWGSILMAFHWVFPLAMPAISLVILNMFDKVLDNAI